MPRDIHFLYFAVCAVAEDVPWRVSVFAQGAVCVSCNSLSLHIGCSVSVGMLGTRRGVGSSFSVGLTFVKHIRNPTLAMRAQIE
jgi:hypothetical protein